MKKIQGLTWSRGLFILSLAEGFILSLAEGEEIRTFFLNQTPPIFIPDFC